MQVWRIAQVCRCVYDSTTSSSPLVCACVLETSSYAEFRQPGDSELGALIGPQALKSGPAKLQTKWRAAADCHRVNVTAANEERCT